MGLIGFVSAVILAVTPGIDSDNGDKHQQDGSGDDRLYLLVMLTQEPSLQVKSFSEQPVSLRTVV